jgi:hypothetical protein
VLSEYQFRDDLSHRDDFLVRDEVAVHEEVPAIECKDHGRNLLVSWLLLLAEQVEIPKASFNHLLVECNGYLDIELDVNGTILSCVCYHQTIDKQINQKDLVLQVDLTATDHLDVLLDVTGQYLRHLVLVVLP